MSTPFEEIVEAFEAADSEAAARRAEARLVAEMKRRNNLITKIALTLIGAGAFDAFGCKQLATAAKELADELIEVMDGGDK